MDRTTAETAPARRIAALEGAAIDGAAIDWEAIEAGLDAQGFGLTGPLLTPEDCASLAALYDRPEGFRKTVVMARHGYGQGEYRYFDAPLPRLVEALRHGLYRRLAPIANRWDERLGRRQRFPETLDEYLALCHAAGQTRPTPLLLKYGPGDYNCLHQDLYGDLVFPLQATILLSPESDFDGGEFLLVEQRPRRQSIGRVAPLRQGEAVIFPVTERPVQGTRGWFRAQLRHGVSPVRQGHRMTLGVIFHDAGK